MTQSEEVKDRLRREGYTNRSSNTLHSFTKSKLILEIRMLENNWAAALERCDNQKTFIESLDSNLDLDSELPMEEHDDVTQAERERFWEGK